MKYSTQFATNALYEDVWVALAQRQNSGEIISYLLAADGDFDTMIAFL